jgi:hypothetical protein
VALRPDSPQASEERAIRGRRRARAARSKS